jgi:hypothetical protein
MQLFGHHGGQLCNGGFAIGVLPDEGGRFIQRVRFMVLEVIDEHLFRQFLD